jgi:hypothetical protein
MKFFFLVKDCFGAILRHPLIFDRTPARDLTWEGKKCRGEGMIFLFLPLYIRTPGDKPLRGTGVESSLSTKTKCLLSIEMATES